MGSGPLSSAKDTTLLFNPMIFQWSALDKLWCVEKFAMCVNVQEGSEGSPGWSELIWLNFLCITVTIVLVCIFIRIDIVVGAHTEFIFGQEILPKCY